MRRIALSLTLIFSGFLAAADDGPAAGAAGPHEGCIRLTVVSPLPCPKVPMDPRIDFGQYIKELGAVGVPDLNSIRIVDVADGRDISHAMGEDFLYGDAGRVEWVIQDPGHTAYDIHFKWCDTRPPTVPSTHVPLIGVGDLLRYNAGQARPVVMPYLSGLLDLTGDGKPDLAGCWNYAHRPGWPWDGIICYPRVDGKDTYEFGDLCRIRYVEAPDSTDFKHFTNTYMCAEFADLNRDGRVDVVYSPNGGDKIRFFLNSGRRDAGGMPVFVASGELCRHTEAWSPCRAVDLNRDGSLDLVVGKTYLRNTNGDGWPFQPGEPVLLDIGQEACFLDIDGDGNADATGLEPVSGGDVGEFRIAWRRNLGAEPPAFAAPEALEGLEEVFRPGYLAAAENGLLVEYDLWQRVALYEHVEGTRFRKSADMTSPSAVMSLSDQAWPFVCDWNGDGVWDLLVGGGYGWPRIVLNTGSNESPAFAEAKTILADGSPIRILRDDVLGSKYWHNMGYPLPAFVDWDGDGLADLMLPNETNRIFWHKNIGTRQAPKFGARSQVLPEGCLDGPEQRARSVRRIEEQNTPYPLEEDQPFFWRTGAAFADFNADGLMDLATLDGATRKLWLFAHYRDDKGELRLRKERPLKLADGRPIDDAIVERASHWTESFRAADWDGDGLTDLVYSCAGTEPAKGSMYLLRNCGDKKNPVFENPVTLCCFGEPIRITAHGPHPAVADMDGDGKPDLLACVEWSVYPFYSHAALTMSERPKIEMRLIVSP